MPLPLAPEAPLKPVARVIVASIVRLVFLFFAGWIAVAPTALPGAHPITRIGLAAVFLALSVLVGELQRLETRFEALMRAIRSATNTSGTGTSGSGGLRTQDEAVTILIRALGSREPDTVVKAHRNLIRLTGQDLPPDKAAWEAWWNEAGDSSAGSADA